MALGYQALYKNTTGIANIGIGYHSLYNNISGYGNVSIGNGSLQSNTAADANTAIGDGSLKTNNSGTKNTAIGYRPLHDNTSGSFNTAVGEGSLYSNTTGNNNTAIGRGSLSTNTIGQNNTAIGYYSLINNIVDDNTAVGAYSLQSNTDGSFNTAVGYDSLRYNTIGGQNTAVGADTALDLSGNSSSYNTFLGHRANVDSSLNIYNNSTALGYNSIIDASNQMVLGGALSGSYPGVKIPGSYVGINGVYNPLSGHTLDVSGVLQVQDGTVDTIYSGILHGLNVSTSNFYYNPKDPTDFDSFKIELDGANCLIYKGIQNSPPSSPPSPLIPLGIPDASMCVIQNNGGDGIALATTTTIIYVNNNGSIPGVGINKSNLGYTLDVSGNVGATSYNITSDYRIKKDVITLGESFTVDNLNPVTYNNINLGKQDIGLIAHELQEIYPFLVTGEKDGEHFQSVNYIGIIGILIKEIQELKKDVKILKENIHL